jgi:hypothetical protein
MAAERRLSGFNEHLMPALVTLCNHNALHACECLQTWSYEEDLASERLWARSSPFIWSAVDEPKKHAGQHVHACTIPAAKHVRV